MLGVIFIDHDRNCVEYNCLMCGIQLPHPDDIHMLLTSETDISTLGLAIIYDQREQKWCIVKWTTKIFLSILRGLQKS